MFKKIYIERTACYGSCPIYQVEIQQDGTVHWNGEMYVSYLGKISFKLPEKKMQRLESLLNSFDYRHFTYEPGDLFATDHPSCVTRVEFDDGYVKEVDHYLGELDSSVKESKHSVANLERFEKKLEQIINIRKYVKQTLYIYYISSVDTDYKCVVSAPNEKEALDLVKVEGRCRVDRIGKDTTDALNSYVVTG